MPNLFLEEKMIFKRLEEKRAKKLAEIEAKNKMSKEEE